MMPNQPRSRPPRTAVPALVLALALPSLVLAGGLATARPRQAPSAAISLPATPVFRFPVVEGSTVSGYFDHDLSKTTVTIYDGRGSAPGSSFYFTCSGVGGATVGCLAAASSEAACADDAELWYNGHRGTDFEYLPDWRTGATCDLASFAGQTHQVRSPAEGRVTYVGHGRYNGNYLILAHDLNGNGDYSDDGLRSLYLHFADGGIVVSPGDIVEVGQLLGSGGMTGLAWTPHLHFEVQRYVSGAWRPVDPYGWSGEGEDPWPYDNYLLWR